MAMIRNITNEARENPRILGYNGKDIMITLFGIKCTHANLFKQQCMLKSKPSTQFIIIWEE